MFFFLIPKANEHPYILPIRCTKLLKGSMNRIPMRGGQLLKEAAVFGPQPGKATRADSTMGPQVPHTVNFKRYLGFDKRIECRDR